MQNNGLHNALYHSCPLYDPAFVPLCFISTAARGSVPVFFMLTGLLMLSRERLELGHFFKRHILRLAGLFLLWSALYAVGSRVASGSFGSAYRRDGDLLPLHPDTARSHTRCKA